MRAWLSTAWILTLLVACGPMGGPSDARGASVPFTGQALYESRHETERGASEAITLRPARFVDVALVDPSGAVVAEGRTDAEGRFAIDGPPSASTVRVFARVRVRGHDAAITRDPLGAEPHHVDVLLTPGADTAVRATDAAGDAGAFHVVDAMLRGLDAVQEWTGRTLPPVYAYWVRGGTRDWSYYRGERPEGSGRYALELMGGEPGQASISDTDEHDEAIILHELGHFVMDRLTRDSSTGGMHPRGVRIDPGLAWEEGRATWFALAVLGQPRYRDTIGVEPWGSTRVDEDLEAPDDPHPGLGSETSVAKILWDLSDGVPGQPDRDEDGVAIGPAGVLEAMIGMAAEEGTYGSIASFLRHLVARGAIERDALHAFLTRIGEPVAELWPDDDADVWPRALGVGEMGTGTVDGLTEPAPSGGRNLPPTGFDAIHTYRVRVPEAGMLVVELEIDGTGLVRERTDLDLELLDFDAERLGASRGQSPLERVSVIVQPGWYVVRVRDGGTGNRAAYRVRATLETL